MAVTGVLMNFRAKYNVIQKQMCTSHLISIKFQQSIGKSLIDYSK